jgi:hypothetical protein
MRSVSLRRLAGFRVDRRRAYRVCIDGETAGKIKPGEAQVFEISPGQHELQLKIDWCTSDRLKIDAGDTGQAKFLCKPRATQGSRMRLGFQILYAITWGRTRYIDLWRGE